MCACGVSDRIVCAQHCVCTSAVRGGGAAEDGSLDECLIIPAPLRKSRLDSAQFLFLRLVGYFGVLFGFIPQAPSRSSAHSGGRRSDLFTSPSEGNGGPRPLKALLHTMQDSMYPTSQVFRSPRSFLFSVSSRVGKCAVTSPLRSVSQAMTATRALPNAKIRFWRLPNRSAFDAPRLPQKIHAADSLCRNRVKPACQKANAFGIRHA